MASQDIHEQALLGEVEVSMMAKRTSNPIRGIVDKLKKTNTEKSFLTLALGIQLC
jgi:hypothetical protein